MTRRAILAAALAALLVGAAPAGAAERPTTPQLIEAARERGELDRGAARRLLAVALTDPARLPARYRSSTPFDATFPLREARREVAAREPKAPGTDPGTTFCGDLSVDPKTQKVETEHFYIEYNPGEPAGGPTIEEYAAILEASWAKEVDQYGWARPPFIEPFEPFNPPLEKYHVRLDNLTPLIFGYVSSLGSYAGDVGDNPHTSWTEDDAQATCMVLNNDFSQFASDPDVPDTVEARRALEATVAHEFLHSVQFAYGGLTGDDDPDLNFSEGMATWMEDEVFEEANDNLRYLYPDFADSMGEHQGDEYSYWFVWRGLVERFGIGVPGGAEQALQGFWEIRSRGDAANTAPLGLDAVDASLRQGKGISLDDAYQQFAVGAAFVRQCGGPLAPPFCFAEGDLYRGGERGRPPSHGAVDQVGGSLAGEVEDNFALNWIRLPRDAAPYDVSLVNPTDAGSLRLSVACDTGSDVRRAIAGAAGAKDVVTARFDPSGCMTQPIAVVTNHTRTAPDPDADSMRTFQVAVNTAPPPPPPEQPAQTPQTQTAPAATDTTVACTYAPVFRGATASPRGRRVRFGFSRSGASRVTVDVFQHSAGRRVIGERLIARYAGRARAFTWNGRANRRGRRVRDGLLSVRFTTRTAGGRVDTRRETLRRSRGRYFAVRDFDRPQSCAGIREYKLVRPAFGGRSNRALDATFVLGAEATVRLEIRRGTRVVRRIDAERRAPGIAHRLRIDAEGLPRGEYELRLIVQGADRPLVERLYARRL